MSYLISHPNCPMIACCNGKLVTELRFASETDLINAEIDASPHERHLELEDQLAAYFGGKLHEFSLSLAPHGTTFQQQVWKALLTIPFGELRTYKAIAELIGRPSAVRAVASAIGANPIAIVIPCHRVIGSNGTLTGFAGGLERKAWLLHLEGSLALQS